MGGPGVYQVVKCGSSGHNIRCRPHMKATPIGMLVHGNTVTAVEEVSYHNLIQNEERDLQNIVADCSWRSILRWNLSVDAKKICFENVSKMVVIC